MKLPRIIAFASLPLVAVSVLQAADAISPIDYTQRNAPYSPAATVAPEKKSPETNPSVQDMRVDKSVLDKQPAAVGDRRSAIEVNETRDKIVRERDSRQPEVVDRTMSTLNHREASISTANGTTTKPQMVVKYQDSLTSASATNMARFPALDRTTGAKINRFVFRKNGADTADARPGTAITPAAGGATVQNK
jgi:hypothetical protein